MLFWAVGQLEAARLSLQVIWRLIRHVRIVRLKHSRHMVDNERRWVRDSLVCGPCGIFKQPKAL